MALSLRIPTRLGHKANAFLRAPAGVKRLALEAAWELLRARLRTLRPADVYTRDLGRLGVDAPVADAAQSAQARELGHVIEVTAMAMPFRAVCLQQAIAARRMLDRRSIPAEVSLGLSREAGPDTVPGNQREAHAWVTAGPNVITGDEELERFITVARFG